MGAIQYAKYLPLMKGAGGVVVPARTARWKLEEANAADDFADEIALRPLIQTGNPGVGGTYRTFNGTTQYARRTVAGDNVLGLVNRPYTFACKFRSLNDGATRQIFNLREGGSATGKLTAILRTEAGALKYYHGAGTGAFAATTLANLTDGNHFALIRLNAAGGSILDYAVDSGTLTNWASGQAGCVAAQTGLFFGIGGDVNELWNDRIYEVSLWTSPLTDDQCAAVFAESGGW